MKKRQPIDSNLHWDVRNVKLSEILEQRSDRNISTSNYEHIWKKKMEKKVSAKTWEDIKKNQKESLGIESYSNQKKKLSSRIEERKTLWTRR